MDLDESKIIAREVLDKQGYKDYKITTYIHTDYTNVFEVKASKNSSKVIVTIAEGDALTVGLITKKTHTIFTEHDDVHMMNNTKESYLLFELEQKLPIGGHVVNRQDIELLLEDDRKYLSGIKIKVNDMTDEMIRESTEKANRIANYLVHQTNIPIQLKKPRVTVIENGKTTHTTNYTVDTVLAKPLDVDIQDISGLIDSNSTLNQRLVRYKEGTKSLSENDFAKAVQLFHQSIEQSKIPAETNYEILRDAASHIVMNSKGVSLLAKFGISIKPGDSLNLNDPYIQFVLEKESRQLQQIALYYINDEIKNASMKSRW